MFPESKLEAVVGVIDLPTPVPSTSPHTSVIPCVINLSPRSFSVQPPRCCLDTRPRHLDSFNSSGALAAYANQDRVAVV